MRAAGCGRTRLRLALPQPAPAFGGNPTSGCIKFEIPATSKGVSRFRFR